ncbi:MAG: S41 family peptidase, partial [Ruminococcus sp.]|nr:S41 family peptidase [Ruminococcus sp.]
MDNDTKHVLTILGLVGCFGAGYFTCKIENNDFLKIGEKFSAVARIEDTLKGKENITFENEEKAVEDAINAYYSSSSDKYLRYKSDFENSDTSDEEEYEYKNTYKMIDDICYINSAHFNLNGIQGFSHAFKECPDAEGFIIDLRNNMGGYTSYSTSSLGNFLGNCEIGMYHYNDGRKQPISIGFAEKKTDKKIVILVNEKTASAAEIFTSAMKQFYEDTVILGSHTYGKGVFQVPAITENSEEINYTAGYYTIGNWQCYDGIGIDPDIELEMKYDPDIICTDDDIQLNA